jgi:hypothetical protein
MTQTQTSDGTGIVHGAPKLILRAEGLALLAVASAAYAELGAGWSIFALLFLVPDVFMLGYLHGPKVGAVLYNLGHSTILPFALIGLGLVLPVSFAIAVGLIWLAHIGFDRAVGYGLKYDDAFKHTHLSGPAG